MNLKYCCVITSLVHQRPRDRHVFAPRSACYAGPVPNRKIWIVFIFETAGGDASVKTLGAGISEFVTVDTLNPDEI